LCPVIFADSSSSTHCQSRTQVGMFGPVGLFSLETCSHCEYTLLIRDPRRSNLKTGSPRSVCRVKARCDIIYNKDYTMSAWAEPRVCHCRDRTQVRMFSPVRLVTHQNMPVPWLDTRADQSDWLLPNHLAGAVAVPKCCPVILLPSSAS